MSAGIHLRSISYTCLKMHIVYFLIEQKSFVFQTVAFLGLRGVSELERMWPVYQKLHPEYKLKVMNVQAQAPNPVIASICYDYNAYNRIVIAPKWTPFLSFYWKKF